MAQRPSAQGRRLRLAAVIVTALAAAAAGAGIVAALHGLAGSGPAAATPGASPGAPAYQGPAQPGGSGALPGGAGMQLLIAGRVTAVSSSSITIRGRTRSVTAAVTGSTRVTGKTSGIGGVSVGDQVSAQVTRPGGRLTAAAIQDPARLPGGLP
jgi:hypothetical protein